MAKEEIVIYTSDGNEAEIPPTQWKFEGNNIIGYFKVDAYLADEMGFENYSDGHYWIIFKVNSNYLIEDNIINRTLNSTNKNKLWTITWNKKEAQKIYVGNMRKK